AVGGDVTGVVAEAPHRCLMQRVDPRVAAGEPAGAPQVRVHDDTGHVALVSSPGWPSTRTYWKPCVVCRGSKTSPSRPAETTWSTMPAASGWGRNGTAGRRWSVVTSPRESIASPWTSVSSVPSGPRFAQARPTGDVLPEVGDVTAVRE